MTRLATPFDFDDDLIIVRAILMGRHEPKAGRFALDTGAALTTIVPDMVDALGYSPRDGLRRTRVHSAIGAETGYTLCVAKLTALQIERPSFLVNVFDLGYEDIDGLLGMNFLSELNYDIRSVEQRILVERAPR